jgi:hypothetical protein
MLEMDSSFLIGDAEKKRLSMTKSLDISLIKRQWRSQLNFRTRDESWMMWNIFSTGFLLPFGQEMPQRIRQMIDTKRSLLTVFQP